MSFPPITLEFYPPTSKITFEFWMEQPHVLKSKRSWSSLRLVFKAIRQWSNVNLGRASCRLYGKLCYHSFEHRNLSNLLHIETSCIFNQVREAFLKGGSINSHSLMNSSKSLILGVNLEPLNFFELLLMTLKSPPYNNLGRLNKKNPTAHAKNLS